MPMIEYEGDKDRVLSNRGVGEKMADIIARRVSRRSAIAGAAGVAVTLGVNANAQTPAASPAVSPVASPSASPVSESPLSFTAIPLSPGEETVVAEGYTATPFFRWGDPVTADAPEFDLANQSAASQSKQAGYNCDFIGWISLPLGSNASDHGLLVVNHEYTNPELMFAGYLTANPDYDETNEDSPEFLANPTQEIVDTELEAHGLSVIEVKRTDGTWAVVTDGEFNRRITGTTPMLLTGPVAGDTRVQTPDDPKIGRAHV